MFQDEYKIEADNSNKVLGNIGAKSGNPLVYRVTEGREDLYKVQQNGDVEYMGKLLKEDRQDEITVRIAVPVHS